MANDGKLYIIVTDQLPGGMNPIPGDETQKKDKEKNTLGDFIQHQFFNLIERQSKQVVNYTLGNIGNFTGDYLLQQQVNTVMGFVRFGEKIGISALAGAKFGAPGIAVAVAATVVTEAVNTGLSFFTGYLENQRQNAAIDHLRTRAGLNGSNNGSRGTEY